MCGSGFHSSVLGGFYTKLHWGDGSRYSVLFGPWGLVAQRCCCCCCCRCLLLKTDVKGKCRYVSRDENRTLHTCKRPELSLACSESSSPRRPSRRASLSSWRVSLRVCKARNTTRARERDTRKIPVSRKCVRLKRKDDGDPRGHS